ncbi:hypothetical protein CWI37_1272p0020 [Hamiltosporidium tvaerminnensis]|uniref:Uncharacterized protein n=1 Tax=Hamiltosporidium tvaerminnensis TaxID=1176355 RepID=A0A4Q9KXF5_9MICR|nr:hypothetical protein CWI37_1272p0020 [Hamiltosporidium tvaerminnensis]
MLKKESVRPCDEALLCYVQDRNIFRGAEDVDQHSNTSNKTLYHVATRSEKNLSHDYTIRHNEVYDLLANELGLSYKCSVDIIPYMMTLGGTTSKPFKAMNNDENGVKHDNRKNILPPIILDGEDSDLEEENEAVKMLKIIYKRDKIYYKNHKYHLYNSCSNYDMSLCIDAKSYNSNDSE